MSSLQIIADLEMLTEIQAKIIKALAARLAELGDVETGQNEIAEADKIYRQIVGTAEQ